MELAYCTDWGTILHWDWRTSQIEEYPALELAYFTD